MASRVVKLVSLGALALAAWAAVPSTQGAEKLNLPVAQGPFQPTDNSLHQYKCPEWFRDAKLGIWAHWGPQAVAGAGDWYAKHIYVQGNRQYEYHVKNYGHPTKFGYKDIIPLWKAEKWDPDRLMEMYKKAGARYFVSMGVHHDNFDLWNSKFNKWNAVNMGPKRDVVGDWQKAAKKQGLKFGVSEHLGASFTWFQTSHGSDKTGPLAGVPYDGADPKYQDLYHFPAKADDKGWYSNDPRWHQIWFNRIQDLVDQYQPDLLYTDGGVPFGNEVGRSLVAHLYNSSAKRTGGAPETVYTCKQDSKGGMWIQDVERGVLPGIQPAPWQTDTSIGDWYYNRNWKYRGADWVIHMLADIVAKNGNLLINVVQRPDGSLDPEAEQVLAGMTSWIAVNGEAIYGTRPWLVHGEGPVRAKGGHFKEDFAYTAKDIRYTTKGANTLYAIAMGWPEDGQIVAKALGRAEGVAGKVTGATLLGHAGEVKWTHDEKGLTVQLPAQKPCEHAFALKITCDDVKAFKPELVLPQGNPPVAPDATANVTLGADDADTHGELKAESRAGKSNLGFWDNPADYASWKIKLAEPATFEVIARCATTNPSTDFVVEVAGQKLAGKALSTKSWDEFADVKLGKVELKAGDHVLTMKPADANTWKAMNVQSVRLVKAGG